MDTLFVRSFTFSLSEVFFFIFRYSSIKNINEKIVMKRILTSVEAAQDN